MNENVFRGKVLSVGDVLADFCFKQGYEDWHVWKYIQKNLFISFLPGPLLKALMMINKRWKNYPWRKKG